MGASIEKMLLSEASFCSETAWVAASSSFFIASFSAVNLRNPDFFYLSRPSRALFRPTLEAHGLPRARPDKSSWDARAWESGAGFAASIF